MMVGRAVLVALPLVLAGCMGAAYVPVAERLYQEDSWSIRSWHDCGDDGRGAVSKREEAKLDLALEDQKACSIHVGSRLARSSVDATYRVRVEGSLDRFLFFAETRPTLKPNETYMASKMHIGPEGHAQHRSPPQEFDVRLPPGTTRLAFDAYGSRDEGQPFQLRLTWTPASQIEV